MGDQFSRKQAALFLNVKEDWLAKGAMGRNISREIPLIRYGKRLVRYDRDDLVKFAANHKKQDIGKKGNVEREITND